MFYPQHFITLLVFISCHSHGGIQCSPALATAPTNFVITVCCGGQRRKSRFMVIVILLSNHRNNGNVG
jgi:hypothetical protein